jgi:hypothetical protein
MDIENEMEDILFIFYWVTYRYMQMIMPLSEIFGQKVETEKLDIFSLCSDIITFNHDLGSLW